MKLFMEIKLLSGEFAVCKLASLSSTAFGGDYVFFAKTDDEISLVCDMAHLPENVTDVESGWRCLKIRGQLDFGMVGVIAGISALLAEQAISIFVVSTYNTDYFLVKAENTEKTVGLLQAHGYTMIL